MKEGLIKGVCPCDKCEHIQLCKEQEWACRPFASFVWSNYYYETAVKIPCRGTFNKILKDYLHKFKEENEDNPKGNEGK